MKVIYKTTYPNGKTYIGKDLTDGINYFGSADSEIIAKDFCAGAKTELHSKRKEILWESETAWDNEVNLNEAEYINVFSSNAPAVGYNRWPKFMGSK